MDYPNLRLIINVIRTKHYLHKVQTCSLIKNKYRFPFQQNNFKADAH